MTSVQQTSPAIDPSFLGALAARNFDPRVVADADEARELVSAWRWKPRSRWSHTRRSPARSRGRW